MKALNDHHYHPQKDLIYINRVEIMSQPNILNCLST